MTTVDAAAGATSPAAAPLGKVRSPWAVIGLSIVTLGIYGLYWHYAVYQEMKDHSGEGIGGVLGLVIAILPVVNLANLFIMPGEVAGLYRRAGRPAPVSALTGLWILLPILGWFVWLFKTQGGLNRYWESLA